MQRVGFVTPYRAIYGLKLFLTYFLFPLVTTFSPAIETKNCIQLLYTNYVNQSDIKNISNAVFYFYPTPKLFVIYTSD